MSDEIRKFGDCFEMFGLRDDDGKQWVLGLCDMQNKAPQSCLDTLITICNDIDTVSKSHKGKQIFCNIKNAMEQYRTHILPQVFSNWLELSAEEQTSLTKLNNFYCGLHILVYFAEVVDKVVLQYEKSVIDAQAMAGTSLFANKNESGAV